MLHNDKYHKDTHLPHYPITLSNIINAKAFILKNDKEFSAEILYFSPFGIELITQKDFSNEKNLHIKIEILNNRPNQIFILKGRMTYFFKKNNAYQFGLRLFFEDKKSTHNERNAIRWNCPFDFLPSGSAINELKQNDHLFFKVSDFSKNGMKISLSLRNKLIMKGQILNALIALPFIGEVSVKGEIRHFEIDEKNQRLIAGVEFLNLSEEASEKIAEYLLNFSDSLNLKTLREIGFSLKSISKWIDFSYVVNESQFDEVVNLRKESYLKINSSKKINFVFDKYDIKAQILIARIKGRIVGSLRAMLHTDESDYSLYEYIGYPNSFPDLANTIEVSRVCVHPQFRKNDITPEMIKRCIYLAKLKNRNFILLSVTSELLQSYLNFGFKKTSINYIHKDLQSKHYVLVLNIKKVLKGKGIRFSIWYKYFKDFEISNKSFLNKVFIIFYTLFKKH